MARLSAHGLSVELPRGWDGEIFLNDEENTDPARPVLHAANIALPRGRGAYGSGAVERMGRRGMLLSIVEFDRASAGTPLFSHAFPRQLRQRDFEPNQLQRALAGQAGVQRFATVGGRAFCIYAVLGSLRLRAVLVPELNRVLETVEITPR
jgi:hypothetical protein